MTSSRIDWTIKQANGSWIATHKDGCQCVARTRVALMQKINEFDAA